VEGGDRDEPLGAGWAPLREPSLRSGSLRSAQPAPSGDVITEGVSFKDFVLEGRREIRFTSLFKTPCSGPKNGVHLKDHPMSRLETDLKKTLDECADSGQTLVVEMPVAGR